MALTENVRDDVMKKVEDRYSQVEIAKMFGLRQSQVSPLIRGERKFSGLTLGTFDKMYPNATVHLHGDQKPAVSVVNSPAAAVGDNNSTNASGVDKFRLMSAILALDIDSDAKVKVLQLLEDF